MQAPAGCIHILRFARLIEYRELNTKAFGMLCLDSRQRSGTEEFLETLMLEGPDHKYNRIA